MMLGSAAGTEEEDLSSAKDYMWRLGHLLSDEDKKALTESASKVGAVLGKLGGGMEKLKGIRTAVEQQHDLRDQLTAHEQFLGNQAKGMAAKVEGEYDAVLHAQKMAERTAEGELQSATPKMQHAGVDLSQLGEVRGLSGLAGNA